MHERMIPHGQCGRLARQCEWQSGERWACAEWSRRELRGRAARFRRNGRRTWFEQPKSGDHQTIRLAGERGGKNRMALGVARQLLCERDELLSLNRCSATVRLSHGVRPSSRSSECFATSAYIISAMRRRFSERFTLLAGAIIAGVALVTSHAQESDWRQPFDPIKIVGNVYYVGTRGLSSFLIVTPAGGILIDSGEAESVPFVRASVERLGFRFADVKIL